MSHNKLRHDKICLNCGRIVDVRFCTYCGQENVQIQDSAIHLILHYIQDLFHYDGKIWQTLKKFFVRPGLVATEYMAGKRVSNLEPIRFYVFSSTVFFLLLFLVVNEEKWNVDVNPEQNFAKRIYNLNQEKKFLKGSPDTVYVDLLKSPLVSKLDSIEKENDTLNSLEMDLTTPQIRDTANVSWIDRVIDERMEARRIKMESKHEGDGKGAANEFVSEVFHKFPLLFFLSMPFFALFLKILYFKSHRKRYVDHFIFSVYHYAFLFMVTGLFVIFQFAINKIDQDPSARLTNVSYAFFGIYLLLYLWFSLERFYQDRWFYRLLKYIMLLILVFITMIILFLTLLFITFLL